MQLRQLEHVEAVYRLRSFTLAANEQHLTQPALSRSVRALEDELGQRLFDRTTHVVEPTAAAEALMLHVVDALASARAIRDTAAALAGGVSGSIRIGTGPYPAHPLLSTVARVLSSTHPDLQVAVVGGAANDLFASLVGRELDFVVCDTSKLEESPFAEDLDAIALPREPLVLVAGADNPLVGRRPTHDELAACPWVLPPPAPQGRRQLPRTVLGPRRTAVPFYEMETTIACLELVRDQRTVTLVPLSVARTEGGARDLRYLIVDPPQWSNDGIVIRHQRTVSPAATEAIALVQAEADRIAAAGRAHRKAAGVGRWLDPAEPRQVEPGR